MLAAYKLRAVPINVNYRYVEDELVYLFDNADAVALVYQAEFSPRIAAVKDRLPLLRHLVVIDDGTGTRTPPARCRTRRRWPPQSPERDFGPRDDDDIYILYTGGTTGYPKGVVWRHEDVWRVLGGGIDFMTGERIADEYQMSRAAKEADGVDRPRARAAHARRRAVGHPRRPVQRQHERADAEVRPARGVGGRRALQDRRAHHHRRRDGPPADRGAPRADLRHHLARVDRVDGGGVLARREGPAPRAAPEPRHQRGRRLHRDRLQRAAARREGRDRERRPG